ncbi:MAG: response regulator transcription factor [Gemmatimonadota bacterium]|nr:response regulator transcription factor [Gemmatimonadota bacterium]
MSALANRAAVASPAESFAPLRSAVHIGLIRVIIADLDPAALSHVRALLAMAPDITVVAEASAPSHTASLAARLAPHIIITEFAGLGGADGIATIRRLATVAPSCRILVISSCPDEGWLLRALDAGAVGFVSERATQEELLSAIRAVVSDQIVLQRSAVMALTRHTHDGHRAADHDASASQLDFARLTQRERTVFRLIAEGYSAPEVGLQLSISKKTVETYKKRIGEKLGFSHRSEYVRFALRVDLLTLAPPT